MNGLMTRLPLIGAVLAAVLMAASLGWQGWNFVERERQREGSVADTGTNTAVQATTSRNDKALATVNLFGDPAAQDQPDPSETENLPETNLRLVLRGVMAGDENSTASALIEDSNNQTEAYLIEDELPGNATLKSVYPNRIIIQRSGVLENLYFPEAKKDGGIRLTSSSETQGASQPASSPQRSSAQRQNQPSNQTGSSTRQEEIRSRLEQLRERLRNNSN